MKSDAHTRKRRGHYKTESKHTLFSYLPELNIFLSCWNVTEINRERRDPKSSLSLRNLTQNECECLKFVVVEIFTSVPSSRQRPKFISLPARLKRLWFLQRSRHGNASLLTRRRWKAYGWGIRKGESRNFGRKMWNPSNKERKKLFPPKKLSIFYQLKEI